MLRWRTCRTFKRGWMGRSGGRVDGIWVIVMFVGTNTKINNDGIINGMLMGIYPLVMNAAVN